MVSGRPSAIEVCWNWRRELGVLAVTTGLCAFIAASLGVLWLVAAAGAGLAAAGALLRWPPARARLIAQAWCVITPHRIRAGCVNARVQTRSGKLPIVVCAVPTRYGERAHLWCRAGITAAHLLAARDELTAACWAAAVRVVPHPRYSHLVTLEIIRNHYPERARLTPQAWPYSETVVADTADDPVLRSG
jgi:hypothetical protein